MEELENFYFDMDDQPTDLMTWAHLFGDFEGRLIAVDEAGGVEVVTVWLGVNDEFDDPPAIYGTLATTWDGDGLREIRTSTRAEAEIAHRVMLDRFRSGAGPLAWPPVSSSLPPQRGGN